MNTGRADSELSPTPSMKRWLRATIRLMANIQSMT